MQPRDLIYVGRNEPFDHIEMAEWRFVAEGRVFKSICLWGLWPFSTIILTAAGHLSLPLKPESDLITHSAGL